MACACGRVSRDSRNGGLMFAGLIRKFCLESQQQRRRSRAEKYQMKGERNDENFFKSFHRNLSKDLFLAMYTPFVGEIKSIPAIFDRKVSNKNFQPTIDHKKRKKRSFWNRWNRYVFRIFIEALSSMGYPMDFKNDKRIETRMRRKLPGYRWQREERKNAVSYIFFLSVDQREMKFPVVLGGLP